MLWDGESLFHMGQSIKVDRLQIYLSSPGKRLKPASLISQNSRFLS